MKIPNQQEYLLDCISDLFTSNLLYEDDSLNTVLTNLKLNKSIEKQENNVSFKIYNEKGDICSFIYPADTNRPINSEFALCCSFYVREISSIIMSLVNYQTIQKLN